MNALDELLNKPKLTRSQLEWAILVTLEHGGEATAMSAAEDLRDILAELAALRRVAEAARGVIDGEQMFGYPSPADMKKLEGALSKCRAA